MLPTPHATRSKPTCRRRRGRAVAPARPGFSMIELLVVIAVVTLLIGLLMPGLQTARRTAYGVMCGANQRQIGIAFILFSEDHLMRLPRSVFQERGEYSEMMAVTTGSSSEEIEPGFDGLGRLYKWRYIDSPRCLHCPAHRHVHTFEGNQPSYEGCLDGKVPDRVFANYHYTGHLKLGPMLEEGPMEERLIHRGTRAILLTDGLRSREDFNHKVGLNVLYADGSYAWEADSGSRFVSSLPSDGGNNSELFVGDDEGIQNIWLDLGIDG